MVNHRFYSDELREFLKTNKLDKFDDIADTILIAIQEMATARKWPPRKTSDLLRPLLFCQTLTVTRSTPHVLASSEASSITKSERRENSLSKSFWEGLRLGVTISCFAWVGIQGWALKNKTPRLCLCRWPPNDADGLNGRALSTKYCDWTNRLLKKVSHVTNSMGAGLKGRHTVTEQIDF